MNFKAHGDITLCILTQKSAPSLAGTEEKNKGNLPPSSPDLNTLPKKARQIYKYSLWLIGRHPICYASQAHIAKVCECSREYVNRCLKWFHQLGLINKINKGLWVTCRYSSRWAKKIYKKTCPDFSAMLTRQKKKITLYCTKRESNKEGGLFSRKYQKLPHHLRRLSKLSEEKRRKLAIFPESVYRFSLEGMIIRTKKIQHVLKKKKKKAIKLRDEFDCLFVSCLRECGKRGIKPSWRQYYLWKEGQ